MKQIEGITASLAPSERRAPWGVADGVIDAAPDAVLAHLIAFEELPKHVPKLSELRVLQRSDGAALVYLYFDLPWPVSNRDYTVRYRWARGDDGTIRIAIEDANELGPKPGDAIRVGFVRGSWELRATSDGKTLARYIWLAELGGSMTRGMIEQTAWKQPLETIRGVRKAMRKK